MMSPRRTLLLVATSALAIAAAGVVVKVRVEGVRALAAADEAWDGGHLDRAQLLYLRAGRWHLPGTGVRDQAARRLLELARSRAEARDWPAAVSAFDDVRGLFYGTSSLTRARGELLDEANRDAAAALASWKLEEGTREPREALEARYLERLTAQDIPAPGWSVVMGLALLGWLGSLGVLAWRWESPRARWPWLAAAAACFGLWLLSLALMGP